MGRWLRWGVILAAVLLSAVWAVAAVADGGEEAESEASASALQPTQIVADIPEAYGQIFPLRWGGGSLLHLKGRLATMGCIANTLFLYDDDRWWAYNQYHIPQSNSLNREFRRVYEEFVPATTLWADCYRICEFAETRPEHEWYLWVLEPDAPDASDCVSHEYLENLSSVHYPISYATPTPCNDDFDPRVKQHVFPVLPLRPDVCIVQEQGDRFNGHAGSNGYGGAMVSRVINAPPVVIVYEGRDVYRTAEERDLIRLKTEIHELCHANQSWWGIQDLDSDLAALWYELWYEFGYVPLLEGTLQGDEFIAIVGFEQSQSGSEWRLPSSSVYRSVYSPDPGELSAELCSMYLLDMMGMRTTYDFEIWNSEGHYDEIPVRRVDVNKWLTPEVRVWLEAYMILPEIAD